MASTTTLALVTGASNGIGFELAKQFAAHGYDLVVAAEDDAIHDVPDQLERYDVRVQPVQVDLRQPDGVDHLYRSATEGDRTLGAAALNAGVGQGDMFINGDLDDDLALIDLNVRSTVHLAKLVLRDMANRGTGRVLFTSSVAATMPGSYQAVYNASKSFIQSLSEAVRDELRETSITVTALLPGPTDTNFFQRAGLANTPIGKLPKDDPAVVAKQGFEALMRGDEKVFAGSAMSKAMATVNRFLPLPDSVKAASSRLISVPFGR